MFLLIYSSSKNNYPQISMSQFQRDLKEGTIEGAYITPSHIVPNGTVLLYYKDASVYKLVTTDVNSVETLLEKNGNIEYTVAEVKSGNTFWDYFIPILSIVAVFFFVMMLLSAQGGGGANNKMMNGT